MNIDILPMDRSHLTDIAAIERLCFSTPWTETMLEQELYNDMASFLVAVDQTSGRVVAYAGLHVVLDEGYIDNVAVRPEFRRQGLAKRLVDVYLRFGEAHLSFLTLEVRASNEAAIALYEKLGFEPVGRRPNYYVQPTEDALLMTKHFAKEAAE